MDLARESSAGDSPLCEAGVDVSFLVAIVGFQGVRDTGRLEPQSS